MLKRALLTLFLLLVGGVSQAGNVNQAFQPLGRLSILVAPSYFHGVHGMAVAPNGDVYAGDVLGQTVWRIPAGSSTPQPFVRGPIGMADDVAIAPDGRIAWTSILDGVLYEQSPGGAPRAIATRLPGINSVGYSKDGRLYASQLLGTDRLYEAFSDARAPRLLLDQNGGLNGFQIDDRGIMFAPQGTLKRVIRLDLASLHLEVLATGFEWPTGVKLDSQGRIYVVDLATGALSRIEHAGKVERIAQFPPGIDNLAIDSKDRILVSSPGDNSIYRVDPATRTVHNWVIGRLSVPGGVAIDTHGQVLIADTFGFKSVNPQTGIIRELGRRPGEPIRVGMNVRTCAGRTTLSHWYESTVTVFKDTESPPERVIQGLKKPQDAIVLANGDLLIAETGRHRIVRVPAGTDTLETFIGGLLAPAGLTCERNGAIFVTDTAAGTLLRVELATRVAHTIVAGLIRPEGIALAANGTLYLAEVGARRLWSLEADGHARSVLAELAPALDPPPSTPPPWIITGVAVAPDGKIYVSSPQTTGLYYFDPSASLLPLQ